MIRKWAFPWFLPVIMLGAVAFVSRPVVCAGWVAWWVIAGRLVNAFDWRGLGRTASGTADYYLRKPS